MSSGQRRPNSVLTRVLERVSPGERTAYQCGCCGLSHDGDRLNCPACGGPVEEQ